MLVTRSPVRRQRRRGQPTAAEPTVEKNVYNDRNHYENQNNHNAGQSYTSQASKVSQVSFSPERKADFNHSPYDPDNIKNFASELIEKYSKKQTQPEVNVGEDRPIESIGSFKGRSKESQGMKIFNELLKEENEKKMETSFG